MSKTLKSSHVKSLIVHGRGLFVGKLNLKNCEHLEKVWMNYKFLVNRTMLPDSVKNIRVYQSEDVTLTTLPKNLEKVEVLQCSFEVDGGTCEQSEH